MRQKIRCQIKLIFTIPSFLIADLQSGLCALILKKMPIVNFVDVSNMGEKALHSHADGKQHKKRLEDHKQVKSFFNPKNATDTTKEPNKTSEPVIITTPVDYVSAASSTPSNASHTKSLDACFQDSTCQKTEIMRA